MTRVIHGQKKSNSPAKKYVSPEEWALKTRPTHPLKQDSVTRRVHIENQANSHPETRQATVSVTRIVHIKNQANSPSETRQCHQKSAH